MNDPAIDLKKFRDRQMVAFSVLMVMIVVVPVVVGAVLLVLTGWLDMAHVTGINIVPNLHRTVWGWLSDYDHHQYVVTEKGRQIHVNKAHRYSPNSFPLKWIFVWVTAWTTYQVCELVAWPIRGFARLAKPQRKPKLYGE